MTSQAVLPSKMSSALYAVVWGGLIAGVLDTIEALIVFRLVLGWCGHDWSAWVRQSRLAAASTNGTRNRRDRGTRTLDRIGSDRAVPQLDRVLATVG